MKKQTYRVVYRDCRISKTKPKIGLPDEARPGDILTHFFHGAFHTREVGSVHKGYVTITPLEGPYGVVAKARDVRWEDFYEIMRVVKEDEKPKAKPKPEAKKAKPEAKPKKAKPEAKPKKAKPSKTKKTKPSKTKKPPAHILEFLDSSYSEDD